MNAQLFVLSGPRQGETLTILEPPFLVGNAPEDDFYVDPEYIYIGERHDGVPGLTRKLTDTFGAPSEDSYDPKQYYKDLAYEVQSHMEETLLRFVKRFLRKTGHENLTLSGGVALNCKATGYIWKQSTLLDDVYIIPFAGDDGIGLGACLAHLVETKDYKRKDYKLSTLNSLTD